MSTVAERAVEFLRQRLAAGPVEFMVLERQAALEGLSKKSLTRARAVLPIMSQLRGYPAKSVWELLGATPAPVAAPTPAPPPSPAPAPPLSDGGPVAVTTVALAPQGLHSPGTPALTPTPAVTPQRTTAPAPTVRATTPPARVPTQRVPPPPPPEPEPISDRALWLGRYFRLPASIVDFGELSHGTANAPCLFCEMHSNFAWGPIPCCPTCARALVDGRPPRTVAEANRIRNLGGRDSGGGDFQTGRQ